jgi:hypothetical protein
VGIVSTAAIPVHVALIDMSATISATELAEVAGALNEQVQADVAPAWKVAASVGAYPEAPVGTWRIELHDTIDQPGAAGYHADEQGQPYAKVALADGEWTVSASHELIEMIVDPFGSRLHSARLLAGWSGPELPSRVRYLMEPGDPCERITYEVGGVLVTDFVLPHFYRSSGAISDAGYSHTGAVKAPLEILDGGYISFFDSHSGRAFQRFVTNGQNEDVELPPEGAMHLREYCDNHARAYRLAHPAD